jgi:hypothetical protein
MRGHYGTFACRRCHDAIYASQVCGKHSRPILQAKRLRTFLELKTYMRQSNRQRRAEIVRFAEMWMSLAEPIDEARGAYEFPR